MKISDKSCLRPRTHALEEFQDVQLLMLIVVLELLKYLPAVKDRAWVYRKKKKSENLNQTNST